MADIKPTMRKENSSSPKPSTNSVVNSLIQTKDEVHTKLLEETKKTADLSNIFTTLDEQLRASIEKTLRNLKTELDKQRKRLLPGIRRLEDASKSLKKSETILESTENLHRNADVKKAARRIKDAKRVVQEFLPANSDLGIQTYIVDQITLLCQKIRQIPLILRDSEFKNKYNIPTDKSVGSDSDSVSSQRTSPSSKTRRQSKDTISNKYHKKYGGHTHTLNGVEMFSSDSDNLDEDFITGQYIPIKVQNKNKKPTHENENSESVYAVIGDELQQSTEYLTPLEFRKAQGDKENRERTRWRQGISSTSTPNRNNLPFTNYSEQNNNGIQYSENTTQNSRSEIKYITTRKPLPLPRKEKVSETKVNYPHADNEVSPKTLAADSNMNDFIAYSYAKAKGIPKRLLPSVPKNAQTYTKSTEDPYSTVASNGTSLDQLDGRVNDVSGGDKVDYAVSKKAQVKNEEDLREIEEMKFKESVETCRQNIIDRLKERYTINPSYRRTPSPLMGLGRFDLSTTMDSDYPDIYIPNSVSDNETYRHKHSELEAVDQTTTNHLSKSLGSSENRQNNALPLGGQAERPSYTFAEMNDRVKSPNTHWSKLVIINSYSPTPDNSTGSNLNATKESGYASVDAKNNSDSLVSKGIMKFESTTKENGNNSRHHFPKAFFLKKSPVRPRSISAEGLPVKTTRYRYRSTSNLYALAPRSREPIQTSDNSLDTLSLRHMGSIESDLDKLCNESKRSIRQEWTQRRSQSLQNQPKTPEKVRSAGPLFVYHSSFRIPGRDKAERCHISSIVMMTDGKIVVLDQRHRYLYTFDRHYKFLASSPMLEFPGGMVAVKDDTVAIAYPYKSKSGVYRLTTNGDIQFQRDIFSPCSKWVNGIGFAKAHLYLLCKGGDVHVLTMENVEVRTISAGMNGRILVHPNGRRFYIIGEGHITRFDAEGAMLSSIEHVGAYSLILLNDILYAVDRQKHRIVSVRFGLSEEHDLIGKAVEYPSAASVSATGEQLLVSQFEESIDVQKTRTIHVYKLENKPPFP